MAQPLFTLRDAMVRFGGEDVLFSDISFSIHAGDRFCLVGRNGCGKSTLFRLIVGEREPDAGDRFIRQGAQIGYLPQQMAGDDQQSIYDFVLHGLAAEERGEHQRYRVDQLLEPFDLDGALDMATLSGGQKRRAHLARALIAEPDILLLDEPTNHLDIGAIKWLETFLGQYRGGVITISHDRAFLRSISNATLWLDQGHIRVNGKGYDAYDAWSEKIMEEEEARLQKMGRKLAEEEHWRQRGVTARRKRNMRRMGELQALRERLKRERSRLTHASGSVQLPPLKGAEASKLVVELEQVKKSFDGRTIIRPFTTRVLRGDKIGIIGRNGTGKSTLLRLMLGQLEADGGEIRRGAKLRFAYFDQNRDQLDPKKTLWETLCPDGGDTIFVGERPRHVVAYLKDFLFDSKQAKAPAGALSGGEANRLLLAKILSQPSDVLVLDEPTNDLDVDTLDMLQEMLSDYEGTVILVSHDRDFMERTVSRIIACEGEGIVQEYVGGYEDYLVQSADFRRKRETEKVQQTAVKQASSPSPPKAETKKLAQKLSYKQQRALELLPTTIAELEAKIARLEEKLADPSFYMRQPEAFADATAQLEETRQRLEQAEEEWLEAAMLSEQLKG